MSVGLFKNEFLNEGRSQIKRKYGEYTSIQVNEKAPVRNEIVRFVGKRFVTNEEMENFLNKISEDRGKEVNSTQWFKRNQKYFEKFENRGQSVWTLSKYGKRVYEFIIKSDSKGSVNESLSLFLAEGALAKKGAKDLDDMNMQSLIDDSEPDIANLFQSYCDKLGEKPVNVFSVDSETHEDDPLMNKIYKYLNSHFHGVETISKDSPGAFAQYDPKLNVVRYDEYGFVGFYFTAKSNF